MTFFEKSKQAKQIKARRREDPLLNSTLHKTRPRNLSESRHSMNLRNVKLFRAVMHDELESAYRITRLMLNGQHLLMPCKMYDIYYLLAVSALCLRRRRQNQIKQINSFNNVFILCAPFLRFVGGCISSS